MSITLLIPFPSVAGHYEQLRAPLCRCQLMELMMKLRWSQDICLVVANFQVWVIMQAQLDALSEVMARDMAFLLITPNIATEHKSIFGLIAVWVLPYHAHYTTLADVVHKLMLLMDGSADWVYAFIQLNKVLSHAPLSSMGYFSTMTDGTPSTDPCGQLHQQVHKLLQHKDMVVCPEGLNSHMEASQFTFKELPLWDAATPSKTTHKLQLMTVDLGGKQAEGVTTTILTSTPVLPPPTDTAEPSSDIAAAINLLLMGAME